MSWGAPQRGSYAGGQGQNPPPPASYVPPGGYQQQQAPQQQPAYAPGYAAPGGYNPAGGQQGAAPGGNNPAGGYGGAPPQSGYNPAGGYGSAPPQGGHNPAGGYGGASAGGMYGGGGGQYGAPSQAAPPGVKPELWNWFQTVDADRSGQITVNELRQALMNGNWSPFNPETCRLMIGMFDRNNSGTIDVQEFAALWKYIEDWKSCFDRFDTDRSGNINGSELHQAFQTFGYNLSPNFVNLCLRVFDRRSTSTMNFDDFIQCSVTLKSLTDQFRAKDVQQKGIIQLQYEEFLMMVLNNNVV